MPTKDETFKAFVFIAALLLAALVVVLKFCERGA